MLQHCYCFTDPWGKMNSKFLLQANSLLFLILLNRELESLLMSNRALTGINYDE